MDITKFQKGNSTSILNPDLSKDGFFIILFKANFKKISDYLKYEIWSAKDYAYYICLFISIILLLFIILFAFIYLYYRLLNRHPFVEKIRNFHALSLKKQD